MFKVSRRQCRRTSPSLMLRFVTRIRHPCSCSLRVTVTPRVTFYGLRRRRWQQLKARTFLFFRELFPDSTLRVCTCQVYAEGTSLVVIGAVSSGGEVSFSVCFSFLLFSLLLIIFFGYLFVSWLICFCLFVRWFVCRLGPSTLERRRSPPTVTVRPLRPPFLLPPPAPHRVP